MILSLYRIIHPPFKDLTMSVSFALNKTATITVNYDRYFNKFHSYTVDGESILLSEMDKTDLSVIRKVLVDRYDFYEAARKLRDFIDSLLESGGEVEQPEDPTLPYKVMLNEVFGITMDKMEGRLIVSKELVQKVCDDIKQSADRDNWKIPLDTNIQKEKVNIGVIMEHRCKQDGGEYVYAKIVKCDGFWAVHTKKALVDKSTWLCIECTDALDALNYIARRFW